MRHALVVAAVAAVIPVGAGAGIADATLERSSRTAHAARSDRATALSAARRAIGGGRVIGVERRARGAVRWEVHLRRDGRRFEVTLDRRFRVLRIDRQGRGDDHGHGGHGADDPPGDDHGDR
jgi:hypothetical protein